MADKFAAEYFVLRMQTMHTNGQSPVNRSGEYIILGSDAFGKCKAVIATEVFVIVVFRP